MSEKQTLEQLQAENAALRNASAQVSADETLIKEKMAAGLTREQAEAVIRNQRAYNAKRAARPVFLKKA